MEVLHRLVDQHLTVVGKDLEATVHDVNLAYLREQNLPLTCHHPKHQFSIVEALRAHQRDGECHCFDPRISGSKGSRLHRPKTLYPVSYTHLTLPTIYSV